MPKLQKHFSLEITPEQFLRACDSTELREVELLLSSPQYAHKLQDGESLNLEEEYRRIQQKNKA